MSHAYTSPPYTIGITTNGLVVLEIRDLGGVTTLTFTPECARWLAEDLILLAHRADVLLSHRAETVSPKSTPASASEKETAK